MDSMNFLNKKYTSVHSTSPFVQSRSRTSRTFLPTQHYSQHLQNQVYKQQINPISSKPINFSPSNTTPSLASNHCSLHPQQLVRHLCLDCIELLCSQCIGEHIAIHKQNNSFPNIQTLKQLKTDMHNKLQQIMQFMFKDKNHPKNLTSNIDTIRIQSSQRIEQLKQNLIQCIQNWINRLKSSIINNIGYQQIKLIQQQMYSLHQQVNNLTNSLNSTNNNVHDIKKAYQIDAQRLFKCYKDMLDKYHSLSNAMKVQIQLNTTKFIQGLQQAIVLKVNNKYNNNENQQVIKVDDEHSEIQENNHIAIFKTNLDNVQKLASIDHTLQFSTDVPLLYAVASGTETLKVLDPLHPNNIMSFQLKGVQCYPLNSTCLLPEEMIVVSGGMLTENKKSNLVQIYDYMQSKIVTQAKLSKGRSSHRTVLHEDKIFFIGGFTSENEQCKQIQVLESQGVKIIQYKCKWGGPNLCIKKGNQIIKITVAGVQAMNLQTYQWHEITTDVPFALSKGMQMASYLNQYGDEEIIIFGDDEFNYKLDLRKNVFVKLSSSISKPIISAITKNNRIYGWTDINKNSIVYFQEQIWKNVEII